MTDQLAAVEAAICTLGRTLEETLDYLYWLRTESIEDQSNIKSMRQDVRDALHDLAKALRPEDRS
jgi:hypothetical protein